MSFDYPGTDAMLNKHIAALAYAVDNGDGSYSLRLVTEADPLPGAGGGGGTIGDVTVTIPDMLEVGGNDSSTATLFTTTDTTSYSAVSLWLNIASGTTLVAEVSNDGTNWRAIYGEAEDTNAQSNSFTASGLYAFAVRAKQFRVRRTVLGSGTSSALAKFRKDPFQPRNATVAATQSGSWSMSVSGTVDVSGSAVSATQSGSWTVGITGTAAVTQSGTWNVGITGTPSVAQSGAWSVGITGTPNVNAIQSGAWSVSIGGTAAVTQSGSWSVSVTGTAAVTQSGSWTVAATQSGNWSTRTQDGSGNAITSTGGALDVNIKTAAALSTSIIRTPRANKGRQRTSITGTTETAITVAGGSGVYCDLFRLVIANAGATDVNVDIRDVSGGSIIETFSVKAGQTVGFSGAETSDQATANSQWTAQASAATTLIVTAEWIKNT